MADDARDVGLTAVIVNRIAQRFAIDGLVGFGVVALERSVERAER